MKIFGATTKTMKKLWKSLTVTESITTTLSSSMWFLFTTHVCTIKIAFWYQKREKKFFMLCDHFESAAIWKFFEYKFKWENKLYNLWVDCLH
jgi:hypothetical protein